MATQIGNGLSAKLLCIGRSHRQCVRVVEPEELGHPDPLLLQKGSHLNFADSRLLEELLGNGPGIFRVNADLPGAQSCPDNSCGTEALFVGRLDSSGLQGLFNHFA